MLRIEKCVVCRPSNRSNETKRWTDNRATNEKNKAGGEMLCANATTISFNVNSYQRKLSSAWKRLHSLAFGLSNFLWIVVFIVYEKRKENERKRTTTKDKSGSPVAQFTATSDRIERQENNEREKKKAQTKFISHLFAIKQVVSVVVEIVERCHWATTAHNCHDNRTHFSGSNLLLCTVDIFIAFCHFSLLGRANSCRSFLLSLRFILFSLFCLFFHSSFRECTHVYKHLTMPDNDDGDYDIVYEHSNPEANERKSFFAKFCLFTFRWNCYCFDAISKSQFVLDYRTKQWNEASEKKKSSRLEVFDFMQKEKVSPLKSTILNQMKMEERRRSRCRPFLKQKTKKLNGIDQIETKWQRNFHCFSSNKLCVFVLVR